MEEDVRLIWDSIPTGKRSIIANQILREQLPKYVDGKVKPGNNDNLYEMIESIVRQVVGESAGIAEEEFHCAEPAEIAKKTEVAVKNGANAIMGFIKNQTK